MNAVTINNIDVNFSITDERVFISSLELSQVFEKRHDRILRAIRNLPQDFFTECNFALSEYTDKTGRILPMYKITRDGFSLLVMGFTGEKAYKWKIEFIKAFNMMEAELRKKQIKGLNTLNNSLNKELSKRDVMIADLQNELYKKKKKLNELATKIVLFDDATYNPAFKELEKLKDDMINFHYKLMSCINGIKERLKE